MRQQDTKHSAGRSAWIITAFLALAGLLHFWETKTNPFLPDTLAHCGVLAIYAALLMTWMRRVLERLTRSQSRFYTLAAAGLMMLYLLSRTMKYRMMLLPMGSRVFWYLNYAPLVGMPTLFLMTCVRFHTAKESPPREMALLAPAAGLVAIVLSNDLHFLVFRPKADLSGLAGATGTYTYGFVYYMIYAWIGLTIAAGVFLLLWKAQKLHDWKKAVMPLVFLALIPVTDKLNDLLAAHGLHRAYGTPEIHIFCMLGVFESCIRSRLMPTNENYPGFFSRLDMPAMITDENLSPVYTTSVPPAATPEQLRAALDAPRALNADTLLFGRKLRVGRGFWSVDESTLHRLNERLEEANETIGMENRLIRYENEQREEKARIDARNAVFSKAARELYPTQKKIAALLAQMEPGTAEFRPLVAHVCALNAYVKRKTNFLLTYREGDRIDLEELYLAVREITDFLNGCGVFASADRKAAASFSFEDTLALLDSFFRLTEALIPGITRMMVFLRGDGLHMTVNGTLPEPAPDTPLPVAGEYSDGLLFLTVPAEGGGAA